MYMQLINFIHVDRKYTHFKKFFVICIVHVHGFKRDIDNMTVRLKKYQNPTNVGVKNAFCLEEISK